MRAQPSLGMEVAGVNQGGRERGRPSKRLHPIREVHRRAAAHDQRALRAESQTRAAAGRRLVQRRVDESMNWRTHDTESEYT